MSEFFLKNLHHFKQITRFLISGGTSTLVNLAALFVLTDYFGVWYLISAVIAFICSFFVSFFLQKFWTFRNGDIDRVKRQLAYYFLVAMFGLSFNVAGIYFLVDILHLWYMLAQVIIGAILAVCNFCFYRFIVFNADSRLMPKKQNEQLKILIATGIYPPDLGGPATILTELPGALKKEGMAIKVITYSDVLLSEEEKKEGMVYRISRQQSSFGRQAKYFFQMLKLSFWADMIYATDTYSVGYFAYVIKALTGKKYLVRFAGDSAWETAVARGWTEDYIVDFQKKKYDSAIEKSKQRRTRIMVKADRIIAVSNFMAEVAGLIGVAKEKITVIYNSVDFFGEQSAKIKPEAPTLVFAGRLMPWKGVEALLYVVAKLKEQWPEIIFEVLGDGPEDKKLKELAHKLKIEPNVKFCGRVSEKDSHIIFARSTIFILNTNYEGLPHSVLNAMRAGLPVITTAVGGNVEVVQSGENGLLVPYNDKQAWVSAISRLLGDESLQAKFVANSQKTLENFRWDKLVAKTVIVLNDICRSNKK
ncbi:MAG TPA: glycosyltransferase [Candidatus Portnoybacteria bacterium]|nr:glycosyltransferase [Candidatus Portnoybacteria bacterium]